MTQEEISVKLADVDQRSKSNTHRINELSGQIDAVNRLAVSVEVLVQENKHQTEAINDVKDDVANLSGKVEAIEQRPVKKWEGIVEKIAKAVIAALVGYIFAKVGLVP